MTPEDYRQALREIAALLETLPSGIDEDADPDDRSPDDATAHVAGLCWKIIQRALDENGETR